MFGKIKLLKRIKGYLRKRKLLKRLQEIEKDYPKVISTTETLDKIISENISIARFGDGEMLLTMGIGLGERGTETEYQAFDSELMERLKYILKNPSPNCLVCIDAYSDKYNDLQNYKDGFSYYENFWLEHYEKVKNFYNKNYTYGVTSISRNTGFLENDISKYRQIWQGRKVLFVIGENSHWVYEPRLFDNICNPKYMVTKGRSSYDEYEIIFNDIHKFDKDWLILLAIGPTSTVLAYELSKEGYQALDIGHMPNCYLQAIGERESPEIERHKDKNFKLKKGIYDKI